VLLSASALALGVLISLPLAVAASRNPRLRWIALLAAGLIQTIPSLALLALFYPLLLALSALSRHLFGAGFSALGFLPSLLALTLYSMLPILRNATTGILGVDPAAVEAARGVGMTDRQRLFMVELPLAAPVIMAGIRTAAVWTIGTATLSTPVRPDLARRLHLFRPADRGLGAGAVRLRGRGGPGPDRRPVARPDRVRRGPARSPPHHRRRAWPGGGHGDRTGAPGQHGRHRRARRGRGEETFSEQYILASLMSDRLRAAGFNVSEKDDLGSAVAYRAVASGEVDAYVDYSGTLWTNVLKRADNPPRKVLLDQLTQALKARDQVVILGPLGFENAYALAMRRDRAQALGIHSIADLASHAPDLTLGSDLEFRPGRNGRR